MFIIVFFFIFMISLNAVKKKEIARVITSKNNIRPIEYEIKNEKQVISKQWFWKGA